MNGWRTRILPLRIQGDGYAVRYLIFASEPDQVKQTTGAAIADAQRLDALYTSYRETSYLSEINRTVALSSSCHVDGETVALLDLSVLSSELYFGGVIKEYVVDRVTIATTAFSFIKTVYVTSASIFSKGTEHAKFC